MKRFVGILMMVLILGNAGLAQDVIEAALGQTYRQDFTANAAPLRLRFEGADGDLIYVSARGDDPIEIEIRDTDGNTIGVGGEGFVLAQLPATGAYTVIITGSDDVVDIALDRTSLVGRDPVDAVFEVGAPGIVYGLRTDQAGEYVLALKRRDTSTLPVTLTVMDFADGDGRQVLDFTGENVSQWAVAINLAADHGYVIRLGSGISDAETLPANIDPTMNFALQFVLNAPARSSTMPFEWKTVTLTSGSTLRYGLVLPENFDPDKTYPVLLAFPPGPQDESMVEAGMGYWAGEASRRDWIIVSPAAPNGRLFFRGSELLIPEFLDHIAEAYHVENDVFHVGGISNGGISAFRTAIDYPERFRSILVLPGYPPAPDDFDNLDRLSDMQVAMFVGAGDSSGWIDNSQRTEESLKALGIPVQLEIVAGEGHVIQSLAADAGRLFDLLDSFR